MGESRTPEHLTLSTPQLLKTFALHYRNATIDEVKLFYNRIQKEAAQTTSFCLQVFKNYTIMLQLKYKTCQVELNGYYEERNNLVDLLQNHDHKPACDHTELEKAIDRINAKIKSMVLTPEAGCGDCINCSRDNDAAIEEYAMYGT